SLYFVRPPTPATCPPSLHDALPIFRAGVRAPGLRMKGVEEMTNQQQRSTSVDRVSIGADRRPPGLLASVVPGVGLLAVLVWQFRSEEHTSELQSRENLVCRLLL